MVLCGSERCSIMVLEYLEELQTDLGPLGPTSFAESSSAAALKSKHQSKSVTAITDKGLKVCKEVGYM